MKTSEDEIKKHIERFEKDILNGCKNGTRTDPTVLNSRFGCSFAKKRLVLGGESSLALIIIHLKEKISIHPDLEYAWCKLLNWIEMDLCGGGPEEYALEKWVEWAELMVAPTVSEVETYKKLKN